VTRSHKFNDKDHAALAGGNAVPHEPLPKYFAKHGFPDADPTKTKKNGAGRANWCVKLASAPTPGYQTANTVTGAAGVTK
jgi:hypothetical protein